MRPLVQARPLLALAGLYSDVDDTERMRAVFDSARRATNAAAVDAVVLPVLRNGPHADATLLLSCLSARAIRTTLVGLPKDALAQTREALQVMGEPRPGQRLMLLAMRISVA